MEYKTVSLRLTGVSPLVCHNGQLADPLNYWSRELKRVTSKRHKVEADMEEAARIEFFGGLYLNEAGAPVIPADLVQATLIAGAKKSKQGPQAKSAMIVLHDSPIEYDGPKVKEDLWNDQRFRLRVAVKVGTSKVMRTRPIFHDWAVNTEVQYLPELVNAQDLKEWAYAAGTQIGIGDWRPRYGRFGVAVVS